jgi:hypothetical protein
MDSFIIAPKSPGGLYMESSDANGRILKIILNRTDKGKPATNDEVRRAIDQKLSMEKTELFADDQCDLVIFVQNEGWHKK